MNSADKVVAAMEHCEWTYDLPGWFDESRKTVRSMEQALDYVKAAAGEAAVRATEEYPPTANHLAGIFADLYEAARRALEVDPTSKPGGLERASEP